MATEFLYNCLASITASWNLFRGSLKIENMNNSYQNIDGFNRNFTCIIKEIYIRTI